MIDPEDLEEFEKHLAKLVGESFDEREALIRDEKLVRFVIRFGIKPNTDKFYWFEIADCAWEILHGNSVIFYCSPSPKQNAAANKLLESLHKAIVKEIFFDKDDLSLLVTLNTGFSLRLLHSKDEAWHYALWINNSASPWVGRVGHGLFYEVKNETIGPGCYDS
jgi:hypothetical protein